jgi:hypothetical protein
LTPILWVAAMLLASSAHAIEYGKLNYGEGKTFQTGVFEPRYIGQLPAEGKAAYLVFSGRGCTGCDANRSIYIHSPDDGPMQGGERDPRYSYPGQYRDPESKQVAYVARMFIGKCLASSRPVALWFQRSLQDSGQWQRGVHVVEVVNDRLVSRAWTKQPPELSTVLAAVKSGTCREIKGVRGYLEP